MMRERLMSMRAEARNRRESQEFQVEGSDVLEYWLEMRVTKARPGDS